MAKMADYFLNVEYKDEVLPNWYYYNDLDLIDMWREIADEWLDRNRPGIADFIIIKKFKSVKKSAIKRTGLPTSSMRMYFQFPLFEEE